VNTGNGDSDENDIRYTVVLNDEEQYSIWPAHREVPAGWREIGTSGSKQQCLDHIDAVWTDMRPKSLRERMAAGEG
jgi:MbtH protein